MTENEKIRQHEAICAELTALYKKKNRDYGDAILTVMEIDNAKPQSTLHPNPPIFPAADLLGNITRVSEAVKDNE